MSNAEIGLSISTLVLTTLGIVHIVFRRRITERDAQRIRALGRHTEPFIRASTPRRVLIVGVLTVAGGLVSGVNLLLLLTSQS